MDKYGEAEHAEMLEEMLEEASPYLEAKFEREELWGLISRARLLGDGVPNPEWKAAYYRLRDAASTLDAFMARGTIHVG